jgi:hypothetical protein
MSDIPRYTITHGDVTVEAVVTEIDGKRIVQPVDPPVVLSGESFTISSVVTDGPADDRTPADRQRDMALLGPCFTCRAEHPGWPPVARLTVTRLLPGNGGVQMILTCPEGHGDEH